MSLRLSLLNRHLRLFEKPGLARNSPERLRRSLEFKSKFYFHPPRGTTYRSDTLADVQVQWVDTPGVQDGRVILYLHGGAYVFGSARTHRAMLAKLSRLTGLRACLPDYRLAPEHRFPAQIDDALACYEALSETHEVILGGDSAGGGLALSLLHEILRRDLRRPLGVFAFSPLTDLTFSGESVVRNAESDNLLSASRVGEMRDMVLGGQDPTDARISPLFGRFSGAPPVWLTAGDTEFLCDDAIRMAERLEADGVACELRVEHDHPHVWTLFHNILPEADRTLHRLANWIGGLS